MEPTRARDHARFRSPTEQRRGFVAHEIAHEEKARQRRDEEQHRRDERQRVRERKEQRQEMHRMIRRRLHRAGERSAAELERIPERPLAMRDRIAHRRVPRYELREDIGCRWIIRVCDARAIGNRGERLVRERKVERRVRASRQQRVPGHEQRKRDDRDADRERNALNAAHNCGSSSCDEEVQQGGDHFVGTLYPHDDAVDRGGCVLLVGYRTGARRLYRD